MNLNRKVFILAILLGGLISIPSPSPGQQGQAEPNRGVRYRLVDLGTLGGPNSYQPFGFATDSFTEASLSVVGTFAGWADTSTADPYAPNCLSTCLVDHAFQWKDGVRTDLGALPGAPGSSSAVTSISPNGIISGFSENGEFDSLVNFPAIHAVIWLNGKITDLETLPGGYESWANAVNNRGQVVGFASNAIYDANSVQGLVTQTRAFLWENGEMKDLGTLGGTDAEALFINERSQIVGQSYTINSIPPPPPHCGDSPLTLHAFFWEKGSMVDLGTLGGSCAFAYALNNRGQVVGQATLDGDKEDHPYIWQHGKMKDLGALGGNYGYAAWLNDSGEVVGGATNEGNQALLAFRWKDDVMSNLGALPGDACSVSDAINSSGQVVGGSGLSFSTFFPACTDPVEHAFLWENGRIIDLNSFVPDSSDLTLNEAVFINDAGQISGTGTLPNGNQHAFLLVPCQEHEVGCEEATQNPNLRQSGPAANRSQSQIQRFHHRPAECTRSCGAQVGVGVNLIGEGTVHSSPAGIDCPNVCSATFKAGTFVSLGATPQDGSTFAGWSGACSGTGGCGLHLGSSKSVTATFSPGLPGFSLTPATSNLTLQSGGQVKDVVTVGPQNGAFASPIQLTCALGGPAPLPSCALSPSSVTPGAMSVSSTLTITASRTSATLAPSRKPAALLSAPSALITMLGMTWITASRKRLRAYSVLFSLVLLMLLQSACGGGGGGTKTQPKSYTAIVTGDSGAIQKKAQISVIVQ